MRLTTTKVPLVDIGANLTDAMFQGIYRGKTRHVNDLKDVLERAWGAGLGAILITSGNLQDIKASRELFKLDKRLYGTVGVHPTRCKEFETEAETPELYLDKLRSAIKEGGDRIVAIGELGLDYARLEFCPKETQKKFFELQLQLAEESKLPLFLHNRDSADDLFEILSRKKSSFSGGVVHSFDGTWEEASKFLELGLLIGINGCSLRSEESLEVVSKLPLESLLLETDSPYCGIRPTHPSFKFVKSNWPAKTKPEKWEKGSLIKARCEPCQLLQVLEVVAALKKLSVDEVARQVYDNTLKLFPALK